MSVANDFGRESRDDGVRRDVLSNDRAGGDDGAGADSYAFHDHCAMTDPDVVSDLGHVSPGVVGQWRVGVLERMGTHPVTGMGVFFLTDEDVGRDGAETADGRDQREVCAASNVGVRTDFDVTRAQFDVSQFDAVLDDQFAAFAHRLQTTREFGAALFDPAFPVEIFQKLQKFYLVAGRRDFQGGKPIRSRGATRLPNGWIFSFPQRSVTP